MRGAPADRTADTPERPGCAAHERGRPPLPLPGHRSRPSTTARSNGTREPPKRHRLAEARAPARSSATPRWFSTETPATSRETAPAPGRVRRARPCSTERRTRARSSSSTPGWSTRPPPSRSRPRAPRAPFRPARYGRIRRASARGERLRRLLKCCRRADCGPQGATGLPVGARIHAD